jgi:glycosyltransferase involved in cell wall biosynthesis
LKQRLDSVLNQTYTDIELIILDDCSTDNSRDIIEQYRSNKKISHIVYNETNSGSTFKQWDKGIQLAKGEYVWIAESDDWCEITLLENIVKGLATDKRCVVGYCQSYCVMDDNRIKFQSGHTSLEEYVDGKRFIKEFLLLRNPIFNAGMAVWRKEAYNKISKEYLNYKLIGDYYFWIELCTCGSVYICGKLLNYFRSHENNVSFNSLKNGLTYTEQLPMLKNLLDKGIIDSNDYLKALKKSYSLFRFSEKDMSKENAFTVHKLFSFYSKAQYKLDFYFIQKNLQQFIRKALRV